MFEYTANWVRVIDGDTVILNVDLGFHTYHVGTFRLKGINAPELKGESRERGLRSKEALEQMLILAGNELRVVSHKTDKYGRYLADLFYMNTDGEEVNINRRLVEEKLAEVFK